MGFMDRVKQLSGDMVEVAQDKITTAVQDKMTVREQQQQDKREQHELERLFSSTSSAGDISVDSRNELFKVRHASAAIPKESGALMKTGKAIAAVYTLGASVAIEHAMKPDDRVFRFSDLLGYELLEDDSEVMVGGVNATARTREYGWVESAKVSAESFQTSKRSVDNLLLRIDLGDIDFPCVIIPYITKSTLVSSKDYRKALGEAQQTVACLERIIQTLGERCDQAMADAPVASSPGFAGCDPIEQVKKLKELLDMGVLTQEEFDSKKRELLGL